MSDNNYSHSHFIKNNLGGFIGIMANIIEKPKNIPEHKLKKKPLGIKNLVNSTLIKPLLVLLTLMAYIFSGGLILQSIELPNEKIKLHQFNVLIDELQKNLTHQNYQNLYSIGKFEELKSNYNYWADWQEASFFAFTLVSTIGYGKVTPQTNSGKIFTIIYIILGVPLGAYSFGLFSSITVKMFSRITEITSDPLLKAYQLVAVNKEDNLTPDQLRRIINAIGVKCSEQEFEDIFDEADIDHDGTISYSELKRVINEKKWNIYNIENHSHQLVYVFILIILYLVLGMFTFHWGEGWSLGDAFYFCIITITTIGLGDFYPKNNKMMVFFFSCIGLGLIAMLIRFSCDIISKKAQEKKEKILFFLPKKKNSINSDKIIEMFHNKEDVFLCRPSLEIYAFQLKNDLKLINNQQKIIANNNDWIIFYNDSVTSITNSEFQHIYEKVKKRDKKNKLYRLKIKFICKEVIEINGIYYVSNSEEVYVQKGNYIIYDILSDNIHHCSKDTFLENYSIEKRNSIDLEDLQKARIRIKKEVVKVI